MSIEAMKQALEALALVASSDEWHGCQTYEGQIATSAYEALRQAIAEAEKQEPVAFRNTETGEFCTGGFLRKDWAKWQPLYTAPVHASDISQERVDETAKDQHDFEQPDLARVGEVGVWNHQREWVGLTDEEKEAATGWSVEHIEAKLKEKNA